MCMTLDLQRTRAHPTTIHQPTMWGDPQCKHNFTTLTHVQNKQKKRWQWWTWWWWWWWWWWLIWPAITMVINCMNTGAVPLEYLTSACYTRFFFASDNHCKKALTQTSNVVLCVATEWHATVHSKWITEALTTRLRNIFSKLRSPSVHQQSLLNASMQQQLRLQRNMPSMPLHSPPVNTVAKTLAFLSLV
jgi:hypothetical protein